MWSKMTSVVAALAAATTICIVWMRKVYKRNMCVPEEWREKQNEYRKMIREVDDDLVEPRLIGGVDISFIKGDNVNACACVVIMSYPDLKIVHSVCRMICLPAPYISGYLAFRECDSILDIIKDMKRSNSRYVPDILMVDGNGVLHPRGVGLASQLGILANIPTIGIAKNLLFVDGIRKENIINEIKSKLMDKELKEINIPLQGVSGRIWGRALCFPPRTTKPIYVSVGHRISLDRAVNLVRNCCKYRVPEPVRHADLTSREYLRNRTKKK